MLNGQSSLILAEVFAIKLEREISDSLTEEDPEETARTFFFLKLSCQSAQ